MSPKRIKQRRDDFRKALDRLQEALAEDPAVSSTIIDGVIQRFEFTFELAWKLGKDVLQYNGIETANPRAVIKEAYQAKWISTGEHWIQMLDDRNRTTHIYDEQQAKKIYKHIKETYAVLLQEFCEKIDNVVNQME